MTPTPGDRSGGDLRGPIVGVAVPAAGEGRRMGGRRKPFLELAGEPVLLRALRPFLEHPGVAAVRVALAPDLADAPPRWLLDLDPRVGCVTGGDTRTASVAAAVAALPAEVEVVLVHDAARPLVDRATVERCVRAAADGTGAVAGWPAVDTLKEVDDAKRVVGTPDRRRIWHAQTPQAFPAALLRRAYEAWDGTPATDDAALVERVGGTVVMVEGSPTNLKVTRPDDLPLAELWLARGSAG